MKLLITGSNGLIGGAAVEYFDALGWEVHGADNNMRKEFFGAGGDTLWNRSRIFHNCKNYHPNDTDIRIWEDVWSVFHTSGGPFDAVIHCAAQPSHDKATQNPQLDYDVNVKGTKHMLEATRQFSPNAVFIFMSTNKVYDDFVNNDEFWEHPTRIEPKRGSYNESTPTGAENVFGQDKLAADQLVQAYAAAGMKAMVLRGGCLTGPGHSGVPQHGFLNYLIRCAASGTKYQIFGYKGKQLRDNLHSYDVARAFHEMIKNPHLGEVYNLGGGRDNAISIMEAIAKAVEYTGKEMKVEYVEEARKGDHIAYVTDMTKFCNHYPNWEITKDLDDIYHETFKQYYWGAYSNHEDTFNHPDIPATGVVLDIGGYRGAWTESLLSRCRPTVHIFEPVAEFADDCKRRFKTEPQVHVHHYGLAAADHFETILKQGQNSSACRKDFPADTVYGQPTPEKCHFVNISKWLMWHKLEEIDLVSMNCEGGEYDILTHLIETGDIKRFKRVQVQFHDFVPGAVARREHIRLLLNNSHEEVFTYPWVWEAFKRK